MPPPSVEAALRASPLRRSALPLAAPPRRRTPPRPNHRSAPPRPASPLRRSPPRLSPRLSAPPPTSAAERGRALRPARPLTAARAPPRLSSLLRPTTTHLSAPSPCPGSPLQCILFLIRLRPLKLT